MRQVFDEIFEDRTGDLKFGQVSREVEKQVVYGLNEDEQWTKWYRIKNALIFQVYDL